MAALWSMIDDPILDREELTHDCTNIQEDGEFLECENCGNTDIDRLYEVADEDASVGYFGSLMVCHRCLDRSTAVHGRRTR